MQRVRYYPNKLPNLSVVRLFCVIAYWQHFHRQTEHALSATWGRADLLCGLEEEFDDTNGAIIIRKTKDRPHNGQKQNDKGTYNDLQNITQKTGNLHQYQTSVYFNIQADENIKASAIPLHW